MNKIFKVIWSKSKQCYVVVSEIAKNKTGKKKIVVAGIFAALAMVSSVQDVSAVTGSGRTNNFSNSGSGASFQEGEGLAIGTNATVANGNTNTVAIGVSSEARGSSSFAASGGTTAAGKAGQVAIGWSSTDGTGAVAIGGTTDTAGVRDTRAIGTSAVALGVKSAANGNNAFAASGGNATGESATAIGSSAIASGRGGVAVGWNAESAVNAVGIGFKAKAKANNTVAIGVEANSDNSIGDNSSSVSIGVATRARAVGSMAMGVSADASGKYSIALGSGDVHSDYTANVKYPKATGEKAIAIGYNSNASDANAIAIGSNTLAKDAESIAVGTSNTTAYRGGVALGRNAKAENTAINNVAIGIDVTAGANTNGTADGEAVAVGRNAKANSFRTVAIGSDVSATGSTAVAMGRSANVSNNYGVAVGARVEAGNYGVALGYQAKSTASGALAIGAGNDDTKVMATATTASGGNSVAIGTSAKASIANAVALGSDSTTATNATNQSSATINSITYNFAGATSDTGMQVSVGAVGKERQIKNVAAGEVSATSTDAINGSQLFAVASQIKPIQYFAVNSSVAGNKDNSGATGSDSVAIGPKAKAQAVSSIALGNNATAAGGNSIAIGNTSSATDKQSPISIGYGATANGDFSIAIGGGDNNTNYGATANGVGGTALGGKTKTTGGNFQTAVGYGATTTAQNASAFGYNATTSVEGGVALGFNSSSKTGVNKGYNPNDNRTNKYNDLNGNVLTSTTGAIAVGNGSTVTRQITGVAAGTKDTDAVNVAQLKSVNLAFKGNVGSGDVNLATNEDNKKLAIKGDASYITTTANGNTITISGKKQDIQVLNGIASANAEGMADVKNVATAINNAISQNKYKWYLTADNDTGGSRSTIDKEGTVKFSGDSNITVARNGNTITTSLNKAITVDSVKVNKTITVGTNKITLDGNTGAVTGKAFNGDSFTAGNNVLSNTTLQIGSPTGGNNVSITRDGLTAKAGTKTVKFGTNGIDAGDQQITHVSSGGNVGTNAANITDVKNAVSDVTLKLDTNAKTGNVKLSEGPLKVIGANGIRTDLVGTNNGSLVVGLDSNTVNATTKGIGLTGDTGSTGLKYLKDGDASFKVAGDGNLVTTKASATGVQVAVDTAKVKDLAVEAVTVSKATNIPDNPITVTPKAGTNSKEYAIGIDTTKLAAKTHLAYTANGGTAKTVSLAKGLNFVNGTNTVATVDSDGKVSFDINKDTKDSINKSATAVGRTITLNADSGTGSSQSLSNGNVSFAVSGATGDYISTTMDGSAVKVSTKRATINSDANTGAASVTGADGLATAKNVASAINSAVNGLSQNLNISDGTNNSSVALKNQKLTVTGTGAAKATVNGQTITIDVAKGTLTANANGTATGTAGVADASDVASAINNTNTVLGNKITKNAQDIATNTSNITANKNQIITNTTNIATNTTNIAHTIALADDKGTSTTAKSLKDGNVSFNIKGDNQFISTAASGNDVTLTVNEQAIKDAAKSASSFKVKANTHAEEEVKGGDTIAFNNGDNIEISQTGKTFTIGTAKNITVDSVTAGNTVINTSGLTNGTTAITGTGITTDKVTVGGISIDKTAGINAGNKVISNVDSGGTTLTNAANIGDVQNAVANLSQNLNITDGANNGTVNLKNQKLNVAGANGVTATVNNQTITVGLDADTVNATTKGIGLTADTGSTGNKYLKDGDVSFAVTGDGSLVSTSATAAGVKVAVNSASITAGADGTITGPTTDGVATAKNVADAINAAKKASKTEITANTGEAANATTGSVTLTSSTAVDGHTIYDVKLNDKVTLGSGTNAVTVDGTTGAITGKTANIGGVTVNGTANTIGGLSNTTWNGTATTGRAATEDQLKAVADAAGSQTWEITADKDAATSGAQTGTKKNAKVGKDDKVQLIAGENLTVNQNERDFTYSLNKNLVKMNSATFEATGGKTTVIKGDSIVQTDGANVNTSNATSNTITDGTNTSTITAGKAQIGTVGIDGVVSKISTGGTNAVVVNGADGTIKTGTVTVTGGTTNDITGLSNTTVTAADFATKGRAATEEQLKAATGATTLKFTGDVATNTGSVNLKDDIFGIKGDGKYISTDVNGKNVNLTISEAEVKKSAVAAVTVSTDTTDANNPLTVTPTTSADGTTKDYKVTIDGTKIANKTNLSYKANDGTAKQVSLADGLNFKNGTLTTASIDDNGVVKYDVNTASITAGTDGTITGPTTDGVATAQNVADAINAAKKASKTEITANTGEAANATTGNVTLTSTTAADGHTIYDVKLNDKVTLGSGANAVTIDGTAGKATIGSSIVDGVNSTFTTGGANAVKLDGAAGTIKTGTVTVTGGTTNDITGLSNTTVTSADFATKGRAATEEQLKAVGEQTWQITADKDATTSGAQTGTKKNAKVGKDDKVQLIAGENLTVNQNERDFTYSLNKDLVKMNSATFEATGGRTTVIKGDSIVQTDGTKVNTSTAGGSTVADGTKSTETTADGQVIKDGAKSNKSTVDSNVIDDGTGNVNTSNATSNTVTDGTNTSTITAGKATIGSSVIDGVNNTFTTGGANAVKLDGAAGTIKTGTVTVTGGTTNDITGLSNTTVTAADFATKGRAATEEQLKAVGEQTWQITADKDATTSGAQTGTKKDAKVGKNDKVQLIAGENMTVNQNERDFTFTLNKDLVKMNSATFEATGGKTTVIKGDSIVQTDGTKVNTSTAAGNTVVDGAKSTATTADGTTVTTANGNTNYAADGVRINTTGKTPVSLTDTGLDNGNNVIKNVASGHVNNDATDNTNAANIADVKKATTTVTANAGEAANATTGNVTLTSTTAADGHTIYDVKLNDKVTLGSGANAVTIDGTAGKATFGSSVVDGVNNTFTTGGANAVKLDGAAGTIKTGTVTVTGGTTNDITGLSNTTVTAADFATKGRAATEEQLKAVGEQTWQITADKDATTSGAQTGTKKDAKVGKNDKVQLIAGENMTVNQNERDFTFTLNKDLVKMNSATFEATGGKTTVIKGDSIVQTDGTKVNTSTAGGNTVADGTKSTETTADGQVIKDGTKTNTSTVDENTLVDGAKSNKATVDSNVVDDGNGNVNTSNATSNTITDGTNRSTITAGKATIGSSVIDGVNNTFTTGGANAVKLDGTAGTIKTGTVTVTGGTTNDITGLSNTTVTSADFATKGRAATEEQLKAVGEQTWQITADKDATTSGAQTGTKKDAKVGKDDKVQLIAGENMTVNQNERDFTFTLNKDLVKMNSATFEATGGKTTVIKGDSIVQTDGTKTNTATASGNTVADGTKSTETTAVGQVIKDGAKTNTSTVDENTIVDGTKSNKSTVDGNTITDGTNTTATTSSSVTVKDNAGNSTVITKDNITTGVGANKVTLDGTAGKATIGSSIVDGVNNTFTTGGANAVKLDGAAGTIKTGTVTVTGGTTNDITGLSNTTVTSADFATKGRAATEEQLKAVGEQTWQITADKDATTSGAQTGTKKNAKVGKDDKVQLIAGENMTVNQNERDFTFTLNKDLVKMNSATFEATGGKTTVIKGDSIVQTDGTKVNTSTAGGNTVADGTKSTETTAAGQVIKDGAKSNKSTVDNNVIDDGNGNVNTSNATSNTITDGTNTTATTSSSVTVKDNAGNSTVITKDNITTGVGGNKITLDGTAGKATVGASVVDGVNNTFTTGGANAVKLDGVAGTIKTGTVTVTGGTTNDITGLANTTVNSADFATKGRAATEEQLKAVGEQTWQITADKDATTSGAQTGTKKDAKVGKDDKVQLIAGENMTVNQNERDFTFTLNKDLVKMNSATFLGTGTNKTVITGDSITQTAGTQTNTSTAGGNTVADGTKSTETTAAGQVIKDGTKTNTSTVDENTIVDSTKSNKSTVDGNTITDGTNTTATTSSSVTVKDNAGNSTVITKDNITTGVGANKVTLDGTAGKATIGSSVVDGVNNTFTTGGANAVKLDGVAGTIKTGTVTVTGGTTNDITGLSNTTVNSADFATKGRAATEEQLKAVGEQTWQITADKDATTSGVQTGTKKDAKVGKDDKVQLIAGENMTVNQNERDFTFTLNKDLVKMNSATFLGTGSNTTVITGNSITQTAGTQTNTSTAAGNTIANGTKSTETTADGQVIKDGAKSNKSTVDSNVIDDGNGHVNTSNATSNTITDGTNTSTITAGKANIGNIAVDGVNNKITVGTGANPVTLDGANGHLDGLTNTTWVPGVTKATTGRAATEDQLQQVSDAVGAGWKVNTGTVAGSSGVSNGAASTKVSSGEEVKLQAGDNLVIDQNGKTVSYSLNKDLTKMNSATFEATGGKTTVIKGDSIVQTDGGKTNTSNAAGNTVVDGNKSTATTAAGTTITDGAKTNTSTADKNVINDGAGNTNVSNATSNTLKNAAGDETKSDAKGVTVKDAAGNNATFTKDGITITKTGKDTVSLTSNGLDNGKNKIVNVAAGVANTDAVNVGQLKEYAAKSTTELTANNGETAGSTKGNIVLTKTTAADGHTIYDNKLNDKITLGTDPTKAVTVDGTTGTVTGLTNKTWTPGSIVSGRAATEDQLKDAVADSGWKAAVDKEGSGQSTVVGTSPEKIKAEETVTFKAGNNMMVTQTGKSISYAVNPELTNMTSATFKDAAGNTTVTNGNGITITSGSANPTNPHAGPVSLTKDGLNNGNNQIKGVAPGTDPTDAVNVSQLNASNANTSQAINQIAGEVQHVGAHAAAMAALKPIQYDPLEPTQVMAGVGNYRGETATALGLAHYTNENTMFNVGVSVGGNHNMVNAGVTHKFGYSPEKKNIPDRYKAGPISSVYVMQDEVSSLKKENAEQKYVIADQAARLTTLEAENEQQRRELAETKKGLDDLKAAVDKLLASKG